MTQKVQSQDHYFGCLFIIAIFIIKCPGCWRNRTHLSCGTSHKAAYKIKQLMKCFGLTDAMAVVRDEGLARHPLVCHVPSFLQISGAGTVMHLILRVCP